MFKTSASNYRHQGLLYVASSVESLMKLSNSQSFENRDQRLFVIGRWSEREDVVPWFAQFQPAAQFQICSVLWRTISSLPFLSSRQMAVVQVSAFSACLSNAGFDSFTDKFSLELREDC